MCGVAGFLGQASLPDERLAKTLQRMSRRGPDAQKWETFSAGGQEKAYLLHARLSVLDLDSRSDQPITKIG